MSVETYWPGCRCDEPWVRQYKVLVDADFRRKRIEHVQVLSR